jgi:general secretion pathway protein G
MFMIKNPGFSMTELVIYIMIVGILMVTVGPPMYKYIGRASERKAQQTLIAIKKALDEYKMDTMHYPNALIDLVRKPSSEPRWREPYLDEDTVTIVGNSFADPWSNPYQYRRIQGGKPPYELASAGDPDKEDSRIDVRTIK